MQIKTISTLLITILLSIVSPAQKNEVDFIFFETEDVLKIKEAIKSDDVRVKDYAQDLRELADYMMEQGPWSITDSVTEAVDDPQDYFSEGPYWWPDPEDNEAPYIKRDGERNPERFTGHKILMHKMRKAVSALSYAAYFFDEKKYADHAAEIIRVWFLNDSTRMNPNLNHAQAIRNKSNGRGVGIIETHRWVNLVEAMNYLYASGYWNKNDYEGVKDWFSEFLTWMLESENGLDEKQRGNNHGSWWAAQVAAYSEFTGRKDLLPMVWDYAKHFLIDNQIKPDGSAPKEEVRTLSFHYSIFNANAHSNIARIAQMNGKNLWEYQSPNGGSLVKVFNYLIPYLRNPERWEKQQISEMNETPTFLVYYSLYDENAGNKGLYRKYFENENPKNLTNGYEPFELVLNIALSVLKN